MPVRSVYLILPSDAWSSSVWREEEQHIYRRLEF